MVHAIREAEAYQKVSSPHPPPVSSLKSEALTHGQTHTPDLHCLMQHTHGRMHRKASQWV